MRRLRVRQEHAVAGVYIAYVSIRQHTSEYVSIRQYTSVYVSIRQHTSAYVRCARASRARSCWCHWCMRLTLLVYAAVSHYCMRPYATGVCALTLLVYAAVSHYCMRPYATSVCGLTLLSTVRRTKMRERVSLSGVCVRVFVCNNI